MAITRRTIIKNMFSKFFLQTGAKCRQTSLPPGNEISVNFQFTIRIRISRIVLKTNFLYFKIYGNFCSKATGSNLCKNDVRLNPKVGTKKDIIPCANAPRYYYYPFCLKCTINYGYLSTIE